MGNRDRLLKVALRDRFLVTMKSGEAFEALLADVDDRTLVMVDGYVVSDAGRHKVDGSLYLSRADVAYMQKPGVTA